MVNFICYKLIFILILINTSILYANDYHCTMTNQNSFTFNQILSKVENNYIAVDFYEEPFDTIYEDSKILLLSKIENTVDDGYTDISSWSINKENSKALSFYSGVDFFEPADAFSVGECKIQ